MKHYDLAVVTVETVLNEHKEFSQMVENDWVSRAISEYCDEHIANLDIRSMEFLRQT